jgi:hypothetical protein
MMAGYASPYARIADVRNKLMLPLDETPPSVVTPGEVPDVPMPGWPAPMLQPDFSGIPEPPMPSGPGTPEGSPMAPPPGLRGKGYVSNIPPPDYGWPGLQRRLQGGVAETDMTMDARRPPAPNADRYMESPLADNLPQMPGYPMEGSLPINARQDPRYIEWLRLMRQRGSI